MPAFSLKLLYGKITNKEDVKKSKIRSIGYSRRN